MSKLLTDNKTTIPQIGKLYRFREDDIKNLYSKWNWRYSGYVLCLENDVAGDAKLLDLDTGLEVVLNAYTKHNPIGRYECYHCLYHKKTGEIERLAGNLFLSYEEFMVMLRPVS